MESVSEISKALELDKKRIIIELYLKEKYKEEYDPLWLNTIGNYDDLAAAIDFFYKLNIDNLNINAIGSDNETTREDYHEQFVKLAQLLDELVVFNGDNPPVATEFKEKDAILAGLDLNQKQGTRSLRDLHAQSSNLGIAEKLFNADLGQTEWLGEVDLERMLIKLGVKDRTHITRLNQDDIGMILHFERVKHLGATAPYTIPLLINCGSSGSLRSQGSHWTYATVTVDPTTNAITIDYQDSMPLSGNEQGILTNAINYTDGAYSAFPGYTTKTVNTNTDNLQVDGWSCGYRALRGLLTSPAFPVHGGVDATPDWVTFTAAPYTSLDMRDVTYRLLLSDLEIDEDYFLAMNLDREMVRETSDSGYYELDSDFTQHYLSLLSQGSKTKEVLTTNNFSKEFVTITKLWGTKTIDTDRKVSLKSINDGILKIESSDHLSSDAKVLALFDLFTKEYEYILSTRGGGNSGLGKEIKKFCLDQFGVELNKDKTYHMKSDGLMIRVLKEPLFAKTTKDEEVDLLPPEKITKIDLGKTSKSAPEVHRTISEKPKVSPSLDISKIDSSEVGQRKLRKKSDLNRMGTMFGDTQLCFAEKSSGVEPGFRAIDLDAVFFAELDRILSDDNLSNPKFPGDLKAKYAELRDQLRESDLPGKQRIFATFINAQVPGPHKTELIEPGIEWLCKEIKGAIPKNNNLSSWLYKLDYAEGGKDRIKANKEALREFVGTRLAGIFSSQNQKQEIVWVPNGKKGAHALLACGWKNGLQELKDFLHGGSAPDYNGILVEDKNAPVKQSKYIRGLGKNLIFGIAIGDRDGMGKDAQNKGVANGVFYGFDYGKPYEGDGVCSSLQDDLTFEDKFAKAPAFLRGTSTIGFARHYMYRNYSVFYDTELSERMFGVHLMKKMITGENPPEEVIKSYPGLRQELYRIQTLTPSPQDLLNQLGDIRAVCKEGGKFQLLADTYIMQISTGKLAPYDYYFAKIKLDLIEEALKNDIPFEELEQYIKFIDEMAAVATKSNRAILEVVEQRSLLTKQEIDLIDKLEKIYSPTSVMSPDNVVFLNTMRFDPPSSRIPFQLTRDSSDNYILSTTDSSLARQLKEDLNLDFSSGDGGVSCKITPENLVKLMTIVDRNYHEKRDALLIKPTYHEIIFPQFMSLLNKKGTPESQMAQGEYLWRMNNSLSLRINVKTEAQAQLVKDLLGKLPTINEAEIFEIPKEQIGELQKIITGAYERENQIQRKSKVTDEVMHESSVEEGIELMPFKPASKWEQLHKKFEESTVSSGVTPLQQEANALIKRYEAFTLGEDKLAEIRNAIGDIADIQDIRKLMSQNDKTLCAPENIQALIEDKLGSIKVIPDEVLVTASSDLGVVQVTNQSTL